MRIIHTMPGTLFPKQTWQLDRVSSGMRHCVGSYPAFRAAYLEVRGLDEGRAARAGVPPPSRTQPSLILVALAASFTSQEPSATNIYHHVRRKNICACLWSLSSRPDAARCVRHLARRNMGQLHDVYARGCPHCSLL